MSHSVFLLSHMTYRLSSAFFKSGKYGGCGNTYRPHSAGTQVSASRVEQSRCVSSAKETRTAKRARNHGGAHAQASRALAFRALGL
eukprot:7770849-Pyramimonas_sp.AAC.1